MTTSRRRDEVRLESVDIYEPENPHDFEFSEIGSFLRSHIESVDVRLRPPISKCVSRKEVKTVARDIARSRVKDPMRPVQEFEALFGEVDYESRCLNGKARVGGVLYDGRRYADICMRMLGSVEMPQTASIVLTDRLVSTYSLDDMRHHLRTIVCGFPCIISLPGIVEAPAKPKEYYLMKQRLELEGGGALAMERLRRMFKGRFVDYEDRAVLKVLNGLSLQAVLYHMTLDPFCGDRECRLFNAHWQEDMISSQIRPAKLCRRHSTLVKSLSGNPVVSWAGS